MGDLQRDVEDLKAVVNQIGEALVKQTRVVDDMALQLRALAEATIELKARVDAAHTQPQPPSAAQGADAETLQTLVTSHAEMRKTLDALTRAHAAVAAKLDLAPPAADSTAPKGDLSE